MIAAARWLLHVGAIVALQPPAAPKPMVVRVSARVQRVVPVERRAGGEYVRADRLAEVVGGTFAFVRGSTERGRLRIGDVTYEFRSDFAVVRAADDVFPLADAPRVADGHLWIPAQFVADVLPRSARNLLFDAEHRELRMLQAVASAAQSTPSKVAPAAPTPAPTTTAPESAPVRPSDLATRSVVRARGTHVVVVDAGHGGEDSGMHGPLVGGPKLDEKTITLAVARQVREALRARGVDVVMTRSRDTLVALTDRGRIANQQRGELFVSIHVNAANPAWKDATTARGFETYFLADAKSEDARLVASRENESVRFETGSSAPKSGDPLGFILSDMAQNAHLRESSRLATLVQRRLGTVHPGPGRGVKQAGFKVLVTASMPAVLVEVGYGTNADDAAFMSSARGQQALAKAIADAAVEYLARTDRATVDGPSR